MASTFSHPHSFVDALGFYDAIAMSHVGDPEAWKVQQVA